MYQQINLYQPVFRQEEKIFSSQTLLIIWGLVVILLFGLYGSHRLALYKLDQSRQQVENQYNRLNQQLDNLLATTDQEQADQVTAEIAQLQLTLETMQTLLGEMNGSALPTAGGFSQLLQGLAEQRLSGVWLTGVEITAQGDIRLTGQASNERLVPRYIQQLRQNPLLADKTFSQIQLTADETSTGVSFILQSGGTPL